MSSFYSPISYKVDHYIRPGICRIYVKEKETGLVIGYLDCYKNNQWIRGVHICRTEDIYKTAKEKALKYYKQNKFDEKIGASS